MSDQNITRLIVGESIKLTLGVPIGQAMNEPEKAWSLRWEGGRWEGVSPVPGTIGKGKVHSVEYRALAAAKQRLQLVRAYTAKRWPYILGAMALVGVVKLAIVFASQVSDSEDVLPFAPLSAAREKTSSVTPVNAPYPLPEAPPSTSEPASSPPGEADAPLAPQSVPVVPIQVASAKPAAVAPAPAPNAGPVVPAVKAQASVPATKAGPQPAVPPQNPGTATKEEVKDAKPQPAVILDVEPAPKAAAQSSAVTVSREVPGKSVPVTQTQLPKPQADRATASKATGSLVAVTPDGRFALFTNAQTRLPEKFAVGERIPTGEVIKSIDRVNGKVKTDSKEYKLE